MSQMISKNYVASSSRSDIRINGASLTPRIKNLEEEILRLKDEIAELILLEDNVEAVSTYGMSYEDSANLPYRCRL